ncbi:MAG: hypothetical protein ACR2K3_02970 [Nocardioides sp.]
MIRSTCVRNRWETTHPHVGDLPPVAGPVALAVGAALPTRVHHILVAAGPGPYHQTAPEVPEAEDVRALELLAASDVDSAVATVTVEGATDSRHPEWPR